MKVNTTQIIYKFVGQIAHFERDSFEQGCDPDSSDTIGLDGYEYMSTSLEGLIEDLETVFGVTKKDMSIEIEGDEGRIDIQLYVPYPHCYSMYNEYSRLEADFKAGKIDITLVTVTGKIYEITKTPVNLEDVQGLLDE